MTALNAKLDSTCGFIFGLHLAVVIAFSSLIYSSASSADKEVEGFGHLTLSEKWHGDFDGMMERRLVRVLVVPDRVGFYIDQGRYRGVSAELLEAFETYINRNNRDDVLSTKLLLLPVARNQIIHSLREGKGDLAVGSFTVSAKRLKAVDFSTPLLTDIKQIIVTNANTPPLSSIDDLSGKTIHLRPSSRAYHSALQLSEMFKKQELTPIRIITVDERFSDGELLQMVHYGHIGITAVADHTATFWETIFRDLKLYRHLSLSTGEEFGWAFRTQSPKFARLVNGFIETTRKGTELGNIIFTKYLLDRPRAEDDSASGPADSYEKVVKLLKKYAERYEFDYLMTKAIAYQESRLDHDTRSPCGAVGIMQLLPATAADRNISIPNIENLEDNVHAGHKYLRFIQDRYFKGPEIDYLNRHLFTFAAYNAGPGKVLSMRKEARRRGLDPNVWFRNVELIAAEQIGRETVHYVGNIYRYYIAYKRAQEKTDRIED